MEQYPNEEGLNKVNEHVTGCFDKLRQSVGLSNIRNSPQWYSSLQVNSKGKASSHSHLFSKISNEYIDDCINNGMRAKAHKRYVYDLFVQIIGDKPISQVTREDARQFKKILLKIPSNLSKHKGIDMDNLDFNNLPKGKPQNHNTINGKLVSLLSLFEWAIQNELYEGLNPFRSLMIRGVPQKKVRQSYSNKELKCLFSSPIYTGCLGVKMPQRLQKGDEVYQDYLYWLPLIGLYSGMRLNEICQLDKTDIKQKDGVWIFDINDSDGRKLKTASSKRVVPIHFKLIETGFLEYIEKQKDGRIFKDVKLGVDGSYSYTFTKIYARLLKKLGLKKSGLCFHSFRHTFIDQLRNSGVERSIAMKLVGHGSKNDIHGGYGYGYTLKTLEENLNKIDFKLPLSN